MTRRNRNRNTAAAATPQRKFAAPTPGIEDVNFTHGNRKATVEFGIVRSKFARHIGIKDKGVMGYKAM